MVAFDAKWFQPHLYELKDNDLVAPADAQSPKKHSVPPLRFRAESEIFWEASECCLINADLSHRPLDHEAGPALGDGQTEIYMNPYVRVAYDKATLGWLQYTRRFERLYPLIQNIVNAIGHRPGFNPRQWQHPGDIVIDRVWKWHAESQAALHKGSAELEGSFVGIERIAKPGQFCGTRKLLYFKEKRKEGESPWDSLDVPKDSF